MDCGKLFGEIVTTSAQVSRYICICMSAFGRVSVIWLILAFSMLYLLLCVVGVCSSPNPNGRRVRQCYTESISLNSPFQHWKFSSFHTKRAIEVIHEVICDILNVWGIIGEIVSRLDRSRMNQRCNQYSTVCITDTPNHDLATSENVHQCIDLEFPFRSFPLNFEQVAAHECKV